MNKSGFSRHRQSKDPLGRAVQLQWQTIMAGGSESYVIDVIAQEVEHDEIHARHFFRSFDEMPVLEQIALQACVGKTLDIGAAAGCHALWLQEKGLDVTALDTSPGAIDVMTQRGISAEKNDFYQFEACDKKRFDTLLLLMNGLGISKTLDHLPLFFKKLDELLAEGGQVLLDSSDFHEFAEDFAEIKYQMYFQNQKTPWFSWLFLPFNVLAEHAQEAGFAASLLHQEEEGAYLARLRRRGVDGD